MSRERSRTKTDRSEIDVVASLILF